MGIQRSSASDFHRLQDSLLFSYEERVYNIFIEFFEPLTWQGSVRCT